MKIAYVAGPYTAKTIKKEYENIRSAFKVGQELARMGFMPFVPHCNSSHIIAQDHAFWVAGDILLMGRAADFLVLIPGWEDSPGSQQERNAALGFGLPVYCWPKDKDKIRREGIKRPINPSPWDQA